MALLYVVHGDGVTTTSSRAGTDLGWLSDVESDVSPSLRGGSSMLMSNATFQHQMAPRVLTRLDCINNSLV